jgi:hypothetical protein
MTGGEIRRRGIFKGSRGNAAGKFFCGCMVSRPGSVSDLGLLTAGTDVRASGASRFFMVFGDGVRAAVIAASVGQRR